MRRGEEEQQGAAVRVVRLQLPDEGCSERLFGAGMRVSCCEVVFRQMMPAPSAATLTAVLDHGLSLTYEPTEAPDQPRGLLVPWSQIAYLRRFEP